MIKMGKGLASYEKCHVIEQPFLKRYFSFKHVSQGRHPPCLVQILRIETKGIIGDVISHGT